MAAIKSESVAGFIPESVADFPRNTHAGDRTGNPRARVENDADLHPRHPAL
jgi:hypothetical protein